MDSRAVPVAPGLAAALSYPVGAAPREWSVYTNTEDAHQVVAGKAAVALATSGGLRTYLRSAGVWRKWTMNHGLPANSIESAAFDPERPEVLWLLTRSAAAGGQPPQQKVVLSTLDLRSEMVATAASLTLELSGSESVPFPQLSLRMERRRVLVGLGNHRGVHSYDRRSRSWPWKSRPDAPVSKLPPGAAGPVQAIHVDQRQTLWAGSAGLYVRDRRTGSATFHAFPTLIQISAPFWMKLGPEGLRYKVVKRLRPTERSTSPAYVVLFHMDPQTGNRSVLSKTPVTPAEADRLDRLGGTIPDRLRGGVLTDLAEDARNLWFATSNEGYVRAGGVARYEVRTGRWSYADPQGEPASNRITQLAWNGFPLALTQVGASRYDRRDDSWRPLKSWQPVSSPYWPASASLQRDPQGRPLNVLGEEPGILWVQETLPYPGAAQRRYGLTRVERATGKRVPLADTDALAHLSIMAVLPAPPDVWMLAEDLQNPLNGRTTGTPLVLRWNRKDNRLWTYSSAAVVEGVEASLRRSGSYTRNVQLFHAAGDLWLWVDQWLLRMDRESETWQVQTRGVWAIFPNKFDLWLRTFNPGDPRDASARHFFRWEGRSWTRLEPRTEFQPFLGGTVVSDYDSYWFAHQGVLRLSKSAARFVTDTPERIGGR